MKRRLVTGIVGFVMLSMFSGLSLADENDPFEQSPVFHVFEVISGIGRPWSPPITPTFGYPHVPEPGGIPYGSSPQNAQSVPHYYLPGSQDPNPFGIVERASTNAPQQQSISQWNPQTNFVQPVPPRQEVRTTALPPQISQPQRTAGQTVQEQLARMTRAEKSRLNAQTDAAFFAKNPQLAGKKVDPVTNPQAAQQWIAERNSILAANARGTSRSTTQPPPPRSVAPQQTQTSVAARNPVPNPQPPPPLKPIPTLPPVNTQKPVAAVPPANTQKPIAAVPPANTLKPIPTVPNLQQQRQSQQTQLAQQQQERLRQAQLAQQQKQERQRQVQLAQQQQQERQRQAQLAQQKEQERQRKVQLAQQKEQDRQLKAYIKQYQKQQAYEQQQAYRQQEDYRRQQAYQQQEAYRQQQAYYQQQAYEQQQRQLYEQQFYQQQQQQNNSAEENFYATHGGRNALTEAAWRSGAYTW